MLSRPTFLFLLAVVLGYVATDVWSSWAAENPTPGVQTANLKQTLERGLKARRPSEFAFIAKVVDLVDQRRLPLKLVMSTFAWARRQVTSHKYPYPYFERALRLRARKLGIDL